MALEGAGITVVAVLADEALDDEVENGPVAESSMPSLEIPC